MALSNAERQRLYRKRKKQKGGRHVTHDGDDVVALLESLPRVKASHDGPYTFTDRAHDFIAVFGGASTAEQGRRVLAQIHQICDPIPRQENADKAGTLAFNEGKRRVMAELMLCMVAKEPLTIERNADAR